MPGAMFGSKSEVNPVSHLIGTAIGWGGNPTEAAVYLGVYPKANDGKVVLDNGVVKVVPNPAPDTVTIIDLGVTPPKVVAEIPVPGSVVGPPMSVAIRKTPSLGRRAVRRVIRSCSR
jgi:hypothetical protein